MRIEVDYDRCTGLGVCESLVPDVFTVDADGTMRIVDGCPADHMRDLLADAAAACPTQALTVVD
jgi:ferredoxin